MKMSRREYAWATPVASAVVLGVATWLGLPSVVRSQVTSEELKLLDKLLAEPDGTPTIEKRLRLVGDALERLGDPKRMLSSSYGINMRRAHIPAADGVPFLVKFLDHQAAATKMTAMHMLGDYGSEARSSVPKLRRLMDDPVRPVREDAMMTLARIDPDNHEIAMAILNRLGAVRGANASEDSMNRAILKALIPMAAAIPVSAVARIAPFREHRWTEVCIYAHEAVGKILNLERPSLDQLRKMETIDWRNTPDHGYAILAAIQAADPKADFAVPLVVELLVSGPPAYLQCMAIDTLGKLKSGQLRIISALLEGLVANDLLVRVSARRALYQIDLRDPRAVRAMAKGLRHANRSVRFEAAVALRQWDQMGKLPPAAHAEMLAPLIETLREVNDEVPPGQLDVYLHLLRNFGPEASSVGEAILKIYTSPTYFQRRMPKDAALQRGKLLAVMANIGVPDSAQPLVMEALKKGPVDALDAGFSYTAAARAIGTFGPQARAAVPLLLPALKDYGKVEEFYFFDWPDGFSTARLEAIRALAKIGPAAKDALPLLKDVVERPDTGKRAALVQQEARRAIEAIEAQPARSGWAAEKPLPRATPEALGLKSEAFAKIDDAVNEALKRGAAPGVVVVVVHKGTVVFRKAYGYRSLEPEKLPMLPEIVFDLASLTKPIATATALMLLIEDGKLKVSDPISQHLPAMRRKETDKITIENLLLHTSGFIPDNPITDYQDGPDKAWQRLFALNPIAEPGKRFSYSDVNYILLGKIAETVSGQPLDVFTARRVFGPLGLDDTTYKPSAKLRARTAPTEKRDGSWIVGTVHDPRSFALGGVAGHAGLFSTGDDLAVFAQMLLNGGAYGGKRILKTETVKYMTSSRPVPLANGKQGLRTYGWDMQTPYAGNRGEVFSPTASYGHSGFTGTSIWIDPTSQTTVIVLTNSVHPNGKGNVLSLRHRVATLAAQAVGASKGAAAPVQ